MPQMTWSQMKQEAAEQGFEKHPVGTYDMKVEGCKVIDGKQYKQLQARFVTQTGPHAGKSIVTRLVPIKNDGDTNGLFFAQMSALGFNSDWEGWAHMDQMGFEQGLQWLAPQIINKMAVIEVTHEPYNGEMRDNVNRIKPYTGGVPVGPAPGPGGGPSQGVPHPPAPSSSGASPAPAAPSPPAQAPQQPQPAPAPPAPQAPAAPAPQAPAQAPQEAPSPAMPNPVQTPQQGAVPQPPQPVTDTPDPF